LKQKSHISSNENISLVLLFKNSAARYEVAVGFISITNTLGVAGAT
jgi:hypothetical protein